MSDRRRGALSGVVAYALWGLFPLYWPLLTPASALEILAHRFVWSFAVVLVLLAVLRSWSWVPGMLRDRRRLGLLSAAAVVVAVNWGTYIWGVNSDHVIETSLGYFINPLVTVLLGVVVLGERLRSLQWAAIGVAALAVALLAVEYGSVPWLALVLALSFGTYGLLKKQAGVGAVESLTVETAVLLVPSAAYLAWLSAAGRSTFTGSGGGHTALLVGAGVVTAVPLLFFGAAATRVPLWLLGVLQYLAPTLQFAVGVLVRHEPLPGSQLVGFGLVWAALVLFTVDGVRTARRPVALAAQAIT